MSLFRIVFFYSVFRKMSFLFYCSLNQCLRVSLTVLSLMASSKFWNAASSSSRIMLYSVMTDMLRMSKRILSAFRLWCYN